VSAEFAFGCWRSLRRVREEQLSAKSGDYGTRTAFADFFCAEPKKRGETERAGAGFWLEPVWNGAR